MSGNGGRENFDVGYDASRRRWHRLCRTFSWALASCDPPNGLLSAVRRDSLVDRFFMGFSLLGVSMPIFWSALLLQYIFALKLGWLPVSGFYGPEYVILPAIVLGWSSAGVIARLTR